MELASLAGAVGVRDSKDQRGPVVLLSPAALVDFLGMLKRGDLDL